MEETDVEVNPTPITAGEKVKVTYQGELAEEAEQVYLHAGVGFGDNWDDITDIEMVPTGEEEWVAELRLNTIDRFNFCFKDASDKWDNNEGDNWSFEVHDGQQYS